MRSRYPSLQSFSLSLLLPLTLGCVLVGMVALFPASLIAQSSERDKPDIATAVFAGGCFWSLETDFEHCPGVVDVIVGYTGGKKQNPTYETYDHSGHREAVLVTYDQKQVTYAGLVEFLLKHVDPLDRQGGFIDRGKQYSSAIFAGSEQEKEEAHRVIDAIDSQHIFPRKIATPVLDRKAFYPAEEYHQDYGKHNPVAYLQYRSGCGRDPFIIQHWGASANFLQLEGSRPSAKSNAMDPSDSAESEASLPAWQRFQKPSRDELRRQLTRREFQVTQSAVTEPAFDNPFWNHHEPGIYIDVVSGEPLFGSQDKFDSGTGWPSFAKPLRNDVIEFHPDRSEGVVRTEVRSIRGQSHLGHVFQDGPAALGGLRFCINSAALRFLPMDKLEEEGYAEFLPSSQSKKDVPAPK